MLKTVEMNSVPAPTTIAPAVRHGVGDIGPRLAGAGALTFVGSVIMQNIIRGGSAPSNGASSAAVLAYYGDHRGITMALVGLFLLSGSGLAAFLGGAMRRLTGGERPAWAFTGCVGAVGIIVLFSVLVGAEEALSVLAHRNQPNLGAVEALWVLHNCVFTLLFPMIAVALVGLSRAGVAAGITPRAFQRIAPLGASLLAVGALAGPFIAAGDAMALFAVGAIGFLMWLAFLITTGLRLTRATVAR